MKKIMVMSLGGSLIVPEKVDPRVLDDFKKTLEKHYTDFKFVVACGGGVIARKYIDTLRKQGKSKKELALAGIRATRMNAQFMMDLFDPDANKILPKNMKEVKEGIIRDKVVFCGALRYSDDATSDETAAKLANYLKSDFINITNVSGLYTEDPKKNKRAKLIKHKTWEEFEKQALKIKFKAGQHFILDQRAAVMIRKHKIRTCIIGSRFENLDKVLNGKEFIGTEIYG